MARAHDGPHPVSLAIERHREGMGAQSHRRRSRISLLVGGWPGGAIHLEQGIDPLNRRSAQVDGCGKGRRGSAQVSRSRRPVDLIGRGHRFDLRARTTASPRATPEEENCSGHQKARLRRNHKVTVAREATAGQSRHSSLTSSAELPAGLGKQAALRDTIGELR